MPVPVSPDPAVVIGVGIDTSRYGHYVTFLNAQLQAAAPPLEVAESRAGYQQLHERFAQLHQHFPTAQFRIRLDAASNYATNLETFLRQLPFPKVLSVGEPTRNKRYRNVHFPGRKSDATESYAAARFAVVERPESSPECPEKLRALREIASRLEAQTRQTTRHVNQLHNLLARVFPELPLLTSTIDSSWVLQLLHKYPTPAKLAKARPASLEAIPYLPADKVQPLLEAARVSIASVTGPSAEVLIEGLVQQVRNCHRQELRLKKLLIALYEELPDNHLATIPGIGKTTAAVLTAKIASIERFNSPNQLVGYFGIFPELRSSGIDQDGQPRPAHKTHMCKRGNDLVRNYLYMAAMAAVRHNPAAIALYRRLAAKGVKGNRALGHIMRKLLHLVFAVWKTGQPFDEAHYPWDMPQQKPAAGRTQELPPADQAVTATGTSTVTTAAAKVNPASSAGAHANSIYTTLAPTDPPAAIPTQPAPKPRNRPRRTAPGRVRSRSR